MVPFKAHYYVSVAGVMGSGKTTMCNLLAQELNFRLFEEKFSENPYLVRYYQEPKRWAYKSQLFYLQTKIAQLVDIKRLLENSSIIQDTPIYQDCFSYAQAQKVLGYMNEAEYKNYLEFFESGIKGLPQPDLIIQLDAPVDVLETRIRRRARDFEKAVDRNYLELLSRLQNDWLEKHRHLKIIRVAVDEKEHDLIKNPDYQASVLKKIKSVLV